MSRNIVVVDYGIGNVFSVCNALKKVAADPDLTRDCEKIKCADRLILPGVGAFGRAMDALREYGLDEALYRYVDTGRPLLGICLGMQMLMDVSFEFGEHRGLGFISGKVQKIPAISSEGVPLRIPHISWTTVSKSEAVSDSKWQQSVLCNDNGRLESCFYFVHSFMAVPENSAHIFAESSYGGNSITAAVQRDNITGVQFHPERSGPAGLALLSRFVS